MRQGLNLSAIQLNGTPSEKERADSRSSGLNQATGLPRDGP